MLSVTIHQPQAAAAEHITLLPPDDDDICTDSSTSLLPFDGLNLRPRHQSVSPTPQTIIINDYQRTGLAPLSHPKWKGGDKYRDYGERTHKARSGKTVALVQVSQHPHSRKNHSA
jgi:hypothetical protein